VIQRTKQMQTRAKCKVCFQIPFCWIYAYDFHTSF
jgi:hypothetical protein